MVEITAGRIPRYNIKAVFIRADSMRLSIYVFTFRKLSGFGQILTDEDPTLLYTPISTHRGTIFSVVRLQPAGR
jgi:hypothetical protein